VGLHGPLGQAQFLSDLGVGQAPGDEREHLPLAGRQRLEPDEFPQHATFADESPIPNGYIEHIQERGLELAVDVPWRPGDLMLIDNILVAHGRRPFEGSRRVLMAMSD
jgi:hypothetical protein